MQLTIDRKALSDALSTCGRFVSNGRTLPVLADVQLSADRDGAFRLSASNLFQAVTIHETAGVSEAGSACVPHRLFADWVAGMSADEVALTWGRGAKLNCKCGRFESNINGHDAAEFPLIPAGDTTPTGLDAAALAGMIERTTFAASDDSSRPALTGVVVDLTPERLTLAATDGYRLSVVTGPGGGTTTQRAIIPAKAMLELGRLLKQGGAVWLALTNNQAIFATGRAVLSTQLIDAKFPDYGAIIPKTQKASAGVAVGELGRALRVAHLFARDTANKVNLELTAEGIVLRAVSAEMGDAEAFAAANVEGDVLTIALNAEYLIDACSHSGTDRLALQFTDPTRPMQVLADGWQHVIMPMQITR